jgi:hypothetical protein
LDSATETALPESELPSQPSGFGACVKADCMVVWRMLSRGLSWRG